MTERIVKTVEKLKIPYLVFCSALCMIIIKSGMNVNPAYLMIPFIFYPICMVLFPQYTECKDAVRGDFSKARVKGVILLLVLCAAILFVFWIKTAVETHAFRILSFLFGKI